ESLRHRQLKPVRRPHQASTLSLMSPTAAAGMPRQHSLLVEAAQVPPPLSLHFRSLVVYLVPRRPHTIQVALLPFSRLDAEEQREIHCLPHATWKYLLWLVDLCG